MSKVYTPLPVPDAGNTTPPEELTGDHAEMYSKVHEHFSRPGYAIPGLEKGELLDEEKFWLTYECVLRYLRATKWDPQSAIRRLEATLNWRREFGIYDTITPELIEEEGVTGKEFIFGYDVDRRPALYMIPSKQNTDPGPRQIQFVVWELERTIDLMGPGVETLSLMINYAEKAKSPSFSTSRTVLNILQDHYPERLGRALILNVPWILNAFYKLITPFIDPITRLKMRFNPKAVEDGLFAENMLLTDAWGGSQDFEYVHEKYWPALLELCGARHHKHMERWRELGGVIGLREWDIKTQSDSDAKDSTQRPSDVPGSTTKEEY